LFPQKQEPHWIESKQVLELGAGIGLPSFSIANKVAHLVISDYDNNAINLLQKNIRLLNLQNVEAICLDWNNFPTEVQTEVLLLSDINYAPDQFSTLLSLIQRFILKGTTIIFSTPQRIISSPFITALEPFIKRTVFQSVLHGQQTVGIYLLILAA
jgi:predicted nicotinamide N-methyase